jgi:hypothetical protein
MSIYLICSIIGGVVVIAGLYMLLWGKDKDREYNASREEQVPDLDCKTQQAKITDVSSGKNGSEQDHGGSDRHPHETDVRLAVN